MCLCLLFNKKERKPCIKEEKDVTVLILVYNAKNTILETIKSIQNQKYCGDIYINVIDDGSTNGSLELLQSIDFDSNVTIIESEHNVIYIWNYFSFKSCSIITQKYLFKFNGYCINIRRKFR